MKEALPLEQLQGHFEIPGVVEIGPGRNRLPRVSITTDLAEAEIYLLGAHVTHFQPRGERPVLFLSRRSHFEEGREIRGGVPVMFPWFGQRRIPPDYRRDNPASPLHGIVRVMNWGIESVEQQSGGEVAVTFVLTADDGTRQIWDGDFVLRYTVTVGRRLEMSLRVINAGEAAFQFEEGLHTYFSVGDIRQVRLEGLENSEFRAKTHNFEPMHQGDEPIRFTAETDRVYQNTQSTCVIDDPVLRRRISITKQGSDTTVVWNPWIDKARAMVDFGDEEWREMVCVETVNAREHAIELPPGGEHGMGAVVSVESAVVRNG